MSVARKRIYATIAYPESVNPDFVDILKSKCIPCFVSPLHNNDKNPDGEKKKPHYHILFMFDGVKTVSQVKAIVDEIGAVGVEPVESVRGYARYLCHLDNPEKTRYNPLDVICLSGADYQDTISLPTDKYRLIGDMMDYISQNQVTNYYQIVDIAREYHYDWWRLLCDNSSFVIKEYIKSRNKLAKGEID